MTMQLLESGAFGGRSAPGRWAFAPGSAGGPYRRFGKRLFDLAVVLLLLPVAVPLVLLLATLAATDGHNPLYAQRRIGRGGRVFRMWKIRTMVPDAEARLAECLRCDPALRAEWDATQKIKRDPRVTAWGRIMRKSSLDELPQLWNVLVGDMSLVGPRPMMADQRRLYPGEAYYRLRPGITGPWQVSDRNASTFAERARFDAEYEQGLSFARDLALLGATVGAVLRGTGY